MGVYSYNVKHNGVFYKAGEYVPDDVREVKAPVQEVTPVPGKTEAGAKPKGRPPKKK